MNSKGQVWIETVIYTLIALAMIAAVLTFAKPKIEEIQDKSRIDQAVTIMDDINAVILDVSQGGAGNKRLLSVQIGKGEIIINSTGDQVLYQMEDSASVYSEPGKDVEFGNLVVNTQTQGKLNKVILTANYSNYNITYAKKDQVKSLPRASNPHKIFISNEGKNDDTGKIIINFEAS